MQQQTTIRFVELELGEAGKAAQSLREAILDAAPNVEVHVQKDDPTNMDLGATLGIVFGAPAVVLIARGIANWLTRKGQTIVVERDGERRTFRATGPVDENAARIAEALLR